jgi:hypothetical protein
VLGANGDPDTMNYAVDRVVKEIAAIPVPTAASARQRRLARHGRAAASAWQSLATRPIGDVTLRKRQEAERLGARYVDELVALGAGACAPLRLAVGLCTALRPQKGFEPISRSAGWFRAKDALHQPWQT